MQAEVTGANPTEYFPTPEWAIHAFLDHYALDLKALQSESPIPVVVDPCAGDGRILRILRDKLSYLPFAINTDIAPRAPNVIKADAILGLPVYMERLSDLTILNPPFSLAVDFFNTVKKYSKRIAMLQRLNFLGSQKRHEFWVKNAPDAVYVYSQRPSFSGDKKTDSQEYAWFVWDYTWTPITKKGVFVI